MRLAAPRATHVCTSWFRQVIDNAKMLSTYVQILRSGVTGRKSLGTAPKRLVRSGWPTRDEESSFAAAWCQIRRWPTSSRWSTPSRPTSRREAFYGYMLGRHSMRPPCRRFVVDFERFKAGAEMTPDVPFRCYRLSRSPVRIGRQWRGMLPGRHSA